MSETVQAYVETGGRRVFAGAVAWPGWCRAARDEAGALEALAAYGPRYASAVAAAEVPFVPPVDASQLTVIERLPGGAGTDFGVPEALGGFDTVPYSGDDDALRDLRLLAAAWATFDAVAIRHADAELRKGPRGGGREVAAIVDHVLGAEGAYLRMLGGALKIDETAAPMAEMARVREAVAEVWALRLRGEPTPRTPRAGSKPLWPPRYFARRSAWHALDHAWEIEDRAG